MADLPVGLSRRQFLTAAGATLALAACGGGDDKADSTTTSTTGCAVPADTSVADPGDGPVTDTSNLVLANFFGGPLFVPGQPLRAPFGIADAEGLLTVDQTPPVVRVSIYSSDGKEVGRPLAIARHSSGLERAYFPLVTTVPEPGIYTVRSQLGPGDASEMHIQVNTPDQIAVVQPGEAFPSLETPTASDARGVNPICTASPACPLHDVTAAQVLTEGKPLALLVATPAFCQVTICGPVLDVLLEARSCRPDVHFLHLEVYADPRSGNLDQYAPAVVELGLQLEPCLFLVGSDGKVARRLDAIYDADELRSVLAELS
jgi:hypothetical protein